jgi:hypothetical protein
MAAHQRRKAAAIARYGSDLSRVRRQEHEQYSRWETDCRNAAALFVRRPGGDELMTKPWNLALGVGELLLGLWLLVFGVNVERWKEQARATREFESRRGSVGGEST